MRKLRISIIAFLAVILTTLTTVYAWLALATINKIENISLNAIANYELLMSLDGETYYNEIPENLIFEKLKRLRFDDVTSLDGITFYDHFDGKKEARPNRDYVSLEIYFQTTTRFTEIYLVNNHPDVDYDNPPLEATYITSRGVRYTSRTKYLYDVTTSGEEIYIDAGQAKTYYAKDAMRISFYQEGQESKIFDLSEDPHRGFGKRYGAHDYFLKNLGVDIPIPTEEPNVIYNLPSLDDEDPMLNEDYLLLTLENTGEFSDDHRPIYEGKIIMNIWLEGFDADAMDGIFDDQLKIQFMFKAQRPKQDLIGKEERYANE